MPLGQVIELAYGANLPKAKRRGGSIPVYGSNGVTGWHDEALVNGPTVIVGRKGSAGAIHLSEGPSFPIDTTYYTRCRAGVQLDIRFLAYALKKLDLSRLRTSTGVPGLAREDAYRELILLPPIDQQLRIVDLLLRAENIVRMRREAESKAKEVIPALFLDMFGDPETNPRGWQRFMLGELVARSRYGPRFPDREYAASGAHILRTTDIGFDGSLRWRDSPILPATRAEIDKFSLAPGVLLVTRTGATIGKAAIFRGADVPCIAGAYLIELWLTDSVDPDYILQVLRSPYGQARLLAGSRAVAQPNLNAPTIKAIQVPVPPIKLQRAFATRLNDLRNVFLSQIVADKKSEKIFDAMMIELFSIPETRT